MESVAGCQPPHYQPSTHLGDEATSGVANHQSRSRSSDGSLSVPGAADNFSSPRISDSHTSTTTATVPGWVARRTTAAEGALGCGGGALTANTNTEAHPSPGGSGGGTGCASGGQQYDFEPPLEQEKLDAFWLGSGTGLLSTAMVGGTLGFGVPPAGPAPGDLSRAYPGVGGAGNPQGQMHAHAGGGMPQSQYQHQHQHLSAIARQEQLSQQGPAMPHLQPMAAAAAAAHVRSPYLHGSNGAAGGAAGAGDAGGGGFGGVGGCGGGGGCRGHLDAPPFGIAPLQTPLRISPAQAGVRTQPGRGRGGRGATHNGRPYKSHGVRKSRPEDRRPASAVVGRPPADGAADAHAAHPYDAIGSGGTLGGGVQQDLAQPQQQQQEQQQHYQQQQQQQHQHNHHYQHHQQQQQQQLQQYGSFSAVAANPQPQLAASWGQPSAEQQQQQRLPQLDEATLNGHAYGTEQARGDGGGWQDDEGHAFVSDLELEAFLTDSVEGIDDLAIHLHASMGE
jgi:hypothetical protein